MPKNKYLLITTLTLTFTAPTIAQDGMNYITVSGGLTELINSNNSGELTSNFTTGAGTSIPSGTELSSGTALGWNTNFDSGYNFAAAFGRHMENGFRGEVEIRYMRSNIASHNNATIGGGSINSEDAGVLITGSDNLGVSVSDLIADGRGKSSTWSFMANIYYDFMQGEDVSPYLGGGIGYADTNILFNPSDVSVADAGNGGFAYQLVGGFNVDMADSWGLFAEYRFFGRDKVNLDLSLLPGFLNVENQAHLVNAGIKFRF